MIAQIFCGACIFVMSLFFGAYVDRIMGGKYGRNIASKADRVYYIGRGFIARLGRGKTR